MPPHVQLLGEKAVPCACTVSRTMCFTCRTLTKTVGKHAAVVPVNSSLLVPYTISASSQLYSAVSYIAGVVTVQPTESAIQSLNIDKETGSSVLSLSISVNGGAAQPVPVTNCIGLSCMFNITAPSAPASGKLTAAVTLSGILGSFASQPPVAFDFTGAPITNIGLPAKLWDAVKLPASINRQTLHVQYTPADRHPPARPELGLSIADVTTYQYTMIVTVRKCYDKLVVSVLL